MEGTLGKAQRQHLGSCKSVWNKGERGEGNRKERPGGGGGTNKKNSLFILIQKNKKERDLEVCLVLCEGRDQGEVGSLFS